MQADLALQLLDQTYGGSAEPTFAFAPGRINLIGEHTDYNEGFVFPAAISLGITLAVRPNGTDTCRLVSSTLGEAQPFTVRAKPGEVTDWAKYAAGMAWVLNAKTGIDAAVISNLPMASGVSSSAALEMAFGVLWNHLENLNHTNKDLALLAQKCENQFVGVNCGIMDQMASAMGKADHALLIDTRNLEIQYAPLPSQLSLVICDTGKPRALTESAYNERRTTCEQAAQSLGLPSLREATLQQVESLTDPVQRKRARHVVTENVRCIDFHNALQSQDLAQIGFLMAQSHASLKNDYEVSCVELDVMVESANNSPGCIGTRMTGAGFGGCCIALVKNSELEHFMEQCEQNFKERVQTSRPTILACQASKGAGIS